MSLVINNTFEPRHEKSCLRVSDRKPDDRISHGEAAQLQTQSMSHLNSHMVYNRLLGQKWNSIWKFLNSENFSEMYSSSFITKTRLFKYSENFTTKNWKFSDKKNLLFLHFCSKHSITKTCLSKYIEHFTTKKWKLSDKKIWYFSHFCSKHSLWVLVRTASARRF